MDSRNQQGNKAFIDLKCAFTSTLVLAHVDLEKKFIIKVDVSDFALWSVLSQPGEDGKLHLIAFHSRKFTAIEINYDIHNKELLVIVDSFEQWRQFLEDFPHQVIVYKIIRISHISKRLEYLIGDKLIGRNFSPHLILKLFIDTKL